MNYYLIAYIAMAVAVGQIAYTDGTVEAQSIKLRIYERNWIRFMYIMRFLVQGALWPIYVATKLLYKILK